MLPLCYHLGAATAIQHSYGKPTEAYAADTKPSFSLPHIDDITDELHTACHQLFKVWQEQAASL